MKYKDYNFILIERYICILNEAENNKYNQLKMIKKGFICTAILSCSFVVLPSYQQWEKASQNRSTNRNTTKVPLNAYLAIKLFNDVYRRLGSRNYRPLLH